MAAFMQDRRNLSTLVRYCPYAARPPVCSANPPQSPAFLLVVTLSLALGIGADSAIFTLIDKVLLRPLPVTRLPSGCAALPTLGIVKLCPMASDRPLSALLSQLLVAFTVEFDGEFERRMGEAGYPGARLSLVVWTKLMRFAAEGEVSVRELTARAAAPDTQIKLPLGCLERWGFVVFKDERREGWGSGRGIRGDWMVRLSAKGRAASRIWPPLFGEIEKRWEKRFGQEEIRRLRRSLQEIAEGPDHRLLRAEELPHLLSRVLSAFQQEFDRESPAPLALCANTVRVLGEQPIPAAEIPRRTGASPETSGVGWQIKPYVVVTPDPNGRRGKVVQLSPRGLTAQRTYFRLTGEIEKRWESKFGGETMGQLRESLEGFFEKRGKAGLLLSECLLPPPGTVRAGDLAPALGRRAVGATARQRMRDLIAQTEAFVRDPVGALPHYPMWDMNRGFGP
jgi:hypothetical protein